MSQRARNIVILAVVAAAIVVGFVVASPGDDDEPAATQTQATETTDATQTTDGTTETETETQTTPRPSRPRTPVVRVRDGQPVGGVRSIRVEKDDQVRFAVRSDVADHVHVHGYDIFKDVAPGKTVRFGFKADIEGVFEVELEDRGEQIVRLTVTP
jgi:hypothetical protein